VHNALGGRLRFLVSGGAPLAPATAMDFFSLGLPLVQGWGVTEASPTIAVQRFSARRFYTTKFYETHLGSVGPALPGVQVRLVDVPEKDIWVQSGGIGEAIVGGDNIFQGYWEAPELTRQAKLDGWLRTGDLARLDKEGNIYLSGRSKFIIVLDSGEKVHPEEVEEKLAASPLVGDICIIGRKTPDRTEVTAIVHPDYPAVIAACERDHLTPGPATIDAMLRSDFRKLSQDLSPFKRVTEVLLADEPLPRTPLHKVARGRLKDEYSFSLARWMEQAREEAS
jgi:long-chain acyl-CoA synthetase